MRWRLAAVAVTLALAAAGCGTTSGAVTDREEPTGGAPSPAGAKEVTDLPASNRDDSCDPTASLRPTGPPPAPRAFPGGSTMAAIVARGKLVVGVDQNTLQFGFRDPASGNIDGFDVRMAREIAAALFGDPNAIQLRVLTSSQRIPALKAGDVDLVVQTMTITCERLKDVDFSSVYYQAGQQILVRKDSGYTGIESLAGKKVCAAEDSTSLANIVNADVDPQLIGMQVAGWTDCLVMLQQNQVDAVSTDNTILAGLAAQDPTTKVLPGSLSQEPYGMAMPKGQDDFVRFVNAVLERMRADGTWARIYNDWVAGLLPGVPAVPPAARYRD
jgi:polar amino acid transport system substrate-binding protein